MTRLNWFNQRTNKKTSLASNLIIKTLGRHYQWTSRTTSLMSSPVMKTLHHPSRLLTTVNNAVAEPPMTVTVESDYVVILAALLCALICVVGLIAVARCAWMRRGTVSNIRNQENYNKGMKKKMIEVIPKFTYSGDVINNDEDCECVICLGEYVNGDEVRVLPQCGHRFHVGCIDTWLSSHSSCPSCRQVLVARKCKKCGELPMSFGGNVVVLEVDKCRQHNYSSSYLP